MVSSVIFLVLYLLSFPVFAFVLIQVFFAGLSLLVFEDAAFTGFIACALIALLLAISFFLAGYRYRAHNVSAQAALLFAVMVWIGMSGLAAVPFIVVVEQDFTHGVFEAVSALTTTGATVLEGLDFMPKSLLLYRQFLQWLGGLGVVIFVVAVLPMLNVGGMRLLKAETPGPVKDEKIAPRVAMSAQYLWSVYLGLTFFCFAGYVIAGMPAYEALAHSFSTVSTGGFSTHDASLGYFDSKGINFVADFFMLAGAVAFPLHFYFCKRGRVSTYLNDAELKVFLGLIFGLAVFIFWSGGAQIGGFQTAFFHVISFMTSTGFTVESLNDSPQDALFILLICGFLGGCAGSTAGGGKIIRFVILAKMVSAQFKQLVHQQGVFSVKYKGLIVDQKVVSSTMAFFLVTILINMICVIAVMGTGLDFWTALTAVSTCQNVVGPAFGSLGSNFLPASDSALWVFSACMLLGRLEYFTVLVLISRRFWRF